MLELINKFRELIDFRDKAIEDKFGENRHSAFNFPENRFWYADHISPIDREIVDVANKLLTAINNVESNLKTIADVFINETLKQVYLNETKQTSEEIIK